MENQQNNGLVFAFQARATEVEGKRISYMFSVRQVAEVLNHVKIQPVPFAPKHARGVTRWRGQILPVLSLEACLGMSTSAAQGQLRFIVVRSVYEDKNGSFNEIFAMFEVGSSVSQLDLPLICEPVMAPDWITDVSFLSGVYQLNNQLFLVMNIEAILNIRSLRGRYVS